jgi:lysozyme
MISYSPDIIARASAQATGISKVFEGCVLHAYPDPATGGEPWTIGFGSTRIDGRAVVPGDTVTMDEAVAMLTADLAGSLQSVIAYTVPALNGDQLGALASFMNNVGPGKPGVKDGLVRLKSGSMSTLLKLVNAGQFEEAAGQFGLWDLGGGRPMPGLARRRAVERDVFLGRLDMTAGVIPAGWAP